SIAALKKTLETTTPELAAAQAAWEQSALKQADWIVLVPESVKARDGSDFQIEEDHSVVVVGAAGKFVRKDVHTVTTSVPVKGVRALRLEALTWPTLPKSGPGTASSGNFVLSKVSAKSGEKNLVLHRPVADFSQDKF